MHRGSFEMVGKTCEVLISWIMQNGYDIVGPSEEGYVKDPSQMPPAELLMEIRAPVRER